MNLEDFLKEWNNGQPQLLVHTSGSTGVPKPLWVSKEKMLNSARITCDFLGLQPGDTALLCMPLDYIAGKMVVVRCIERHLQLIAEHPSGHPLSDNAPGLCFPSMLDNLSFAALVPMQIYNSLQVSCERKRLMNIKNLIIGGGAIDKEIERELKDFPHAVWSTYGMTETLSHIALRRLNGPEADDWYSPFDSVRVSLNNDSCLVIDAPLVCETQLTTHDIAEIKETKDSKTGITRQQFRIKGRWDNVICCGGIKIQIEDIEEKLRPHLAFPFMVVKKVDCKFGEIPVLISESENLTSIMDICKAILPKYWIPKEFVYIPQLPLTETGKPRRNYFT